MNMILLLRFVYDSMKKHYMIRQNVMHRACSFVLSEFDMYDCVMNVSLPTMISHLYFL